MNGNAENAILYVVILILVILCSGSPDLLGAIIAWVGRH